MEVEVLAVLIGAHWGAMPPVTWTGRWQNAYACEGRAFVSLTRAEKLDGSIVNVVWMPARGGLFQVTTSGTGMRRCCAPPFTARPCQTPLLCRASMIVVAPSPKSAFEPPPVLLAQFLYYRLAVAIHLY